MATREDRGYGRRGLGRGSSYGERRQIEVVILEIELRILRILQLLALD